MNKQKVLILGGGFGGVKAALELCGNDNFQISLMSDQADFRFYPALFETATGRSSKASTIPLVDILDDSEVTIIKATAKTIDKKSKTITDTNGLSYPYDILIIALGVITNYFGIRGLQKYAYGIKTQSDAKELRDHIHQQVLSNKSTVSCVIVGGGPTGVELACALPSYIDHILKQHKLPKKHINIELVESSPRLTPRMSPKFSKVLEQRLKALGITVHLGKSVVAETADDLKIQLTNPTTASSSQSLPSDTVIWTAGVTNHPFFRINGFELDDHGKVKVDNKLQAGSDIIVIGDNASTPYSGMAQTALYDAIFVAANLKRASRNLKTRRYSPKKPIYVIPGGPHWAMVEWGDLRFWGTPGWLLRTAADWIAYHDLEPFWKASRLWFAQRQSDSDCPTCDQ